MDIKHIGGPIASARDATHDVDRQLRSIVQLEYTADPSHFDEENAAALRHLELLVERGARRLCIAYSVLPLAPLLADFDAAFGRGNPQAIDYFAEDTDYPFSPLNELVKERLADLDPLEQIPISMHRNRQRRSSWRIRQA